MMSYRNPMSSWAQAVVICIGMFLVAVVVLMGMVMVNTSTTQDRVLTCAETKSLAECHQALDPGGGPAK